jgi:hypothetical protein
MLGHCQIFQSRQILTVINTFAKPEKKRRCFLPLAQNA